jgi:hypothetical protein
LDSVVVRRDPKAELTLATVDIPDVGIGVDAPELYRNAEKPFAISIGDSAANSSYGGVPSGIAFLPIVRSADDATVPPIRRYVAELGRSGSALLDIELSNRGYPEYELANLPDPPGPITAKVSIRGFAARYTTDGTTLTATNLEASGRMRLVSLGSSNTEATVDVASGAGRYDFAMDGESALLRIRTKSRGAGTRTFLVSCDHERTNCGVIESASRGTVISIRRPPKGYYSLIVISSNRSGCDCRILIQKFDMAVPLEQWHGRRQGESWQVSMPASSSKQYVSVQVDRGDKDDAESPLLNPLLMRR